METVLLYQIKGTKTAALLKPVLLKLGIRVRIVEPEQYLQSIGFLAGNKAFAESPEAYDGAGFDEPMMVMAGFSERKLDLFLTEMRRKKVPPIALKAIVTTQNQAWNSLQQRIKRRTRKNEIVPEITGLVKKSGIGTFSSCHHSL